MDGGGQQEQSLESVEMDQVEEEGRLLGQLQGSEEEWEHRQEGRVVEAPLEEPMESPLETVWAVGSGDLLWIL